MHEAGLINYAERRGAARSHPCSLSTVTRDQVEDDDVKMSMLEATAAFVLLAGGTALAVIAFIAELVRAKAMQHFRRALLVHTAIPD